MKKEDWVVHIEESEGIQRHTKGGCIFKWKKAIQKHIDNACPLCKARKRTRYNNELLKKKHKLKKEILPKK